MDVHRILITGGAGFIGANLAVMLRAAFPSLNVTVLDNLSRRGSALNLTRLRDYSISFVHGDVRCPHDVLLCGAFDAIIHCAANPSVHAGLIESPAQMLQTNLVGALHCLEAARAHNAAFMVLSTSRVYPIAALNAVPWHEEASRFVWEDPSPVHGVDGGAITEEFTLEGPRSFYGASKLACEMLAREYAFSYGMPVIINRCGIVTGPWQMGKPDQGVVSLWLAAHAFGSPLRYTGFGGDGKQVRDILDVADLAELIVRQLETMDLWDGRCYNVGGGPSRTVSLRELSVKCEALTGKHVPITAGSETSPVDLRIFVTNAARAESDFRWSATRSVDSTLDAMYRWMMAHEGVLRATLGE